MTDDAIEVRDNPDEDRYELFVDGELAGVAEYRDREDRRVFVHTVVEKAYAGRGLGNRLAKGALEDAVARGLRVVPRCPFIRAWLERHPDHAARLVG